MKFRVKDVQIRTGGPLVAILNQEDATLLDLKISDRILIKHGKKEITVILDISDNHRTISNGTIGLFSEVLEALHVRDNDHISISIAQKPRSVGFIKCKLEGKALLNDQIDEIVCDIVQRRLSDIELSYFVAACYTRGLNTRETVELTQAIVRNGDRIVPNAQIVVDKHCSGGVPNNRTTMIVVPIITALGYTMPKTSSRAITSPAGTADTMEVLAKVSLPINKIRSIVNKHKGCMVWGGGLNLASADDKMIKVRRPVSLDPQGMLLASILAKKHAVSATHVLIDIPLGPDTKIKTNKQAQALKKKFIQIGNLLGMKIKVIITDGSQPIGCGVGPALEARDVLKVLTNDPKAPRDLREKSITLCENILKMIGSSHSREDIEFLIREGKALKQLERIVKAQGGSLPKSPDDIPVGKFKCTFRSRKRAMISHINNRLISKIARMAGAPFDKGAGVYLHGHVGNIIEKGKPLFTIYANNLQRLHHAQDAAEEDFPLEL